MSSQNDDPLIDTALIKKWKSLKKKPTVIVFDLDFTLWPYFVDHHVTPPISKKKLNKREVIVDSDGFEMSGFVDVSRILKTLKEKCLGPDQHLAIASRSTTPELAMETIELHGWKNYFSSFQIYPRNKTEHMKKIKEDLKFDKYQEVLFFDDEYHNIMDTSYLGVCAIEINRSLGLNIETLLAGLDHFSK
jgi:magnesium-dependent phosphatase 1